MSVVKEPKVVSDKDTKSKKKDKKLLVADGAVKKSHKKAARQNELDDSAAPKKKSSKSKRVKECADDEHDGMQTDTPCSTVAVESSPSKASKKSSNAKDAKRKRDAETDAAAEAAPKKGKPVSLDEGDAQGDNAKAVKVPPPAVQCTSLIRAR